MLAGPHPRSPSLGGPASPGFPPAPRSSRRRFLMLAGPQGTPPPPLALTRRPGFAGLPSGASLEPQALLNARGAPRHPNAAAALGTPAPRSSRRRFLGDCSKPLDGTASVGAVTGPLH